MLKSDLVIRSSDTCRAVSVVLDELSSMLATLRNGEGDFRDALVESASRIFGGQMAMIALVEGDKIHPASQVNTPPLIVEQMRCSDHHGFVAQLFGLAKPAVIADASAEPALRDHPLYTVAGMHSFMGAPLRSNASDGINVYGCLAVMHQNTNQFSAEDAENLASYAQLLASAMLEQQIQLQRYRKEYRKSRAIFQGLGEGIIETNKELLILEFNAAAERILGYRAAQVAGRTVRDLLTNGGDQPDELFTHESNGKEWEQLIITGDGVKKTVRVRANKFADESGALHWVLLVADRTEVDQLREQLEGRFGFANIVGKNHQMQQIYHRIEQVAASNASVLITGESGTGKELIASAIHYNSSRKSGPFVKVSCAALAESLLESELFGHVRGAFTGAVADKIGRFELADNGTLFLDEIGDISPLIQLKLLRVLQEKSFERVGDSATRKVDVRIIAATNKDLRQLMETDVFREDLFYRLKVVTLHLPPLRERKDDIPLLIYHFLERYNAQTGKSILRGDRRSMSALMHYHWPGNIRELENAIEHVFVTCNADTFRVADLPPEIPQLMGMPAPESIELPEAVTDEKTALVNILRQCHWNRSKAARMLGISRTTLWKRIKFHGLEPAEVSGLPD